MKRSIVWFVIVLALLVAGLPAMAVASPPAQDPGWFAEYYANHDLAGAPALTRYEPAIDYNWGTGSPTPILPTDNFSIRWTRTMGFSAGTYQFCATVDDGVRLWVDGQLLIDSWKVQGVVTLCATPYLTGGNHTVQMAYFEDTGNAQAKLTWAGPIPSPPVPGPPIPWPPSPADAWTGEYYDDMMLGATTSPAKPPVMVRMDMDINFNWGTGGPSVGLQPYEFSVRWTRDVSFTPGTYTFCASVDDGVRVWVDGTLILDEWREQSLRTFCSTQYMTGGLHTIQVSYLQKRGDAAISFSWSSGPSPVPPWPPVPPFPPVPEPTPGPWPPPVPTVGWAAEYYSNQYLDGAPTMIREDPEINFDWGYGAPAPGLPYDHFSVRWSREVFFNNGTYTFYARHDDGVRVYVDGSLVIDSWYDQAAHTHSGMRSLGAGTHRVQVDYYENTQLASIQVWWTPGGPQPPQPPQPPWPWPTPIPPQPPCPWPTPVPPWPPGPSVEVMVDNTDPGFIWGGPISSRHFAYLGIGGNMYWTYNSVTNPINYGKWVPRLRAPGYYEVFAFIPRDYATSTNVRYRVIHGNGQRHDRIVNQQAHYDRWVSLGTYYFNASQNEFVLVYDNTREPYGTRAIAFDAVKFVPRW
jgi:hypothetical protein